MKLFRNLVINGLIVLCPLMAASRVSYRIDLTEAPDIIDSYFTFPEANSQYVYRGNVVDIFRWQIQTSDSTHIHCTLTDEKWISISENTSFAGSYPRSGVFVRHFKDDRYFVDIFPWKRLESGKTAYLASGNIEISFADAAGNILSGPDVKPVIETDNLIRSFSDSLQYLILTNQTLLPAAESLAELYNEDIDDTYLLNTDITLMDTLTLPVRDFLLQEINANSSLQYVLFLGDETVIPPMYIFTYDPTIPGLIQRPSDDFFTSEPENSAYPQVTTGRVPVNQLSHAMTFVDRVRGFVLNPVSGNWREKLVLLADDTNKNDGEITTEISHVQNSDEIYRMLNPLMEIQPVYGTEYEPVPGDGWLLQPEMTQTTLESINNGIAMMNYIGHGSPTTLADEKIILMDRDINSIHDPTGAIWVVGTCSFGWYDYEDCMTEKLLSKPDGSIGVISTTFKVNVFSNSNYLMRLFDLIRGYIELENSYRLGDLVRYSKNGGQDYWFHTFGDPAMPLPFPRKGNLIDASFTSTSFDILQPFNLQLLPGYGLSYGYADIRGAELSITRLFDSDFGEIALNYILPGDVIYQGEFNANLLFIVPLDISLCDTCVGSVRVYTEDDAVQTDYLENIPILPFSGNLNDTEGPSVNLRQNDTAISDQGVIFSPFIIQLWMSDDSGLNLTGSIGHSLRYQFDDHPPVDFTDLYTSVSPTEGFLNLEMTDESSGDHTLWVEAWDNANNRSEILLNLYFSDAENFHVELIYNYPNPFSDDTYFTFQLSHPADVSIRVFTSDGRPLITLKRHDLGAGYQSIYWDGKDSRGFSLANGTYFYNLTAHSGSGENFDSIQKITRLK